MPAEAPSGAGRSRLGHATSGEYSPAGSWPRHGSFAEHGYAGTTIRAVAQAADVDPALVYHYYDSREKLLDATTTLPRSFLERIVVAWQTPPDAAELARP